jgi:hypothetical protein
MVAERTGYTPKGIGHFLCSDDYPGSFPVNGVSEEKVMDGKARAEVMINEDLRTA